MSQGSKIVLFCLYFFTWVLYFIECYECMLLLVLLIIYRVEVLVHVCGFIYCL